MVALTTTSPTTIVNTGTGLAVAAPAADLKRITAMMARIADRKSSIAMLANVAIRVDTNGTMFAATDLNIHLTYIAPWYGSRGGLCVNAKSLADLAKSVKGSPGPGGRESVEMRQGTALALTVASDGLDTTLIAAHERDFPKIPTTTKPYTAIDGDKLAALIGSVAYATCQDETRFHLGGVYLETDGKSARVVATDGHRLTLAQDMCIEEDGLPRSKGVIIHGKGARELVKLLQTAEGKTSACVDGDRLYVRRGGWEIAIKLIDAKYPPYEQVIPKEHKRVCTVERKPLMAALKRAKAMCTRTRGAKLTLADGKLTITSDHPDQGSSSESLKASSEYADNGGGFVIGISAEYLLQAIDEIDDKHVTIEAGAELDPVLVRGTEDACNTVGVMASRYLNVTMPMRI